MTQRSNSQSIKSRRSESMPRASRSKDRNSSQGKITTIRVNLGNQLNSCQENLATMSDQESDLYMDEMDDEESESRSRDYNLR